MDVYHFLKPFTVTSGEMLFHAFDLHQLNNTFIFLDFLVFKLLGTHKEYSQFSVQIVLVEILNVCVCVLDICVVSVV